MPQIKYKMVLSNVNGRSLVIIEKPEVNSRLFPLRRIYLCVFGCQDKCDNKPQDKRANSHVQVLLKLAS